MCAKLLRYKTVTADANGVRMIFGLWDLDEKPFKTSIINQKAKAQVPLFLIPFYRSTYGLPDDAREMRFVRRRRRRRHKISFARTAVFRGQSKDNEQSQLHLSVVGKD